VRSHRTPTGIIESPIAPRPFRPPRSPHAPPPRWSCADLKSGDAARTPRRCSFRENASSRGIYPALPCFFRDNPCDRQSSRAAGAGATLMIAFINQKGRRTAHRGRSRLGASQTLFQDREDPLRDRGRVLKLRRAIGTGQATATLGATRFGCWRCSANK
jgi:hypothetical protein